MVAGLIAQFRLQAQLFAYRYGWLPIVALAMLLGAAWLHFFATAAARDVVVQHKLALGAVRDGKVRAEIEPPLLDRRHAAFVSHLAVRASLPGIIKTFFSAARANKLVLQQMDYKLEHVDAGRYLAYRMTAPVRGEYAQIRLFVAGVLTQVPSAALEEISFRRDGIASATTEVKLAFVVFLKDAD